MLCLFIPNHHAEECPNYLPQDPCRRKSGRIKFYFLSFFHLALLLRNKIYFKFYTEVFRFGVRDEDFFNESKFLNMYIIVYYIYIQCNGAFKKMQGQFINFQIKECKEHEKIDNLSNWNLAGESQYFPNIYTWWEEEGILYFLHVVNFNLALSHN